MSFDPGYDRVRSKGWDSTLFARLLSHARPHRALFARSFAILVALFALQLAGPWIWRRALDGPIAAWAADPGGGAARTQELYGWAGLYLFVVVATALLRYQEVAFLTRTGQRVVCDLRTRIFRHIQKLDLGFFDARPTGSLVTRVTSDVEHLNEMFVSGVVTLFFDLCKIAVILALIFWLDTGLGVAVLLLTPLLILTSHVFRGGAREAYREVRARHSAVNGYLQESLSGMRVVQAFDRGKTVSRRLAERLAHYFQGQRRAVLLFALFFPTMALITTGIRATGLWVSGNGLVTGDLTYGVFIQFWMYLGLLIAPIRELGERYNVLQAAFASAERLFEIEDTVPRLAVPEEPASPPPFRGHFRFEDVSFRYGEDTDLVVKDLSFEVEPGQTVAVVGPTGAGKTTLAGLMLRLYDPTSGRITLDGVDLREYPLAELRARTGLVLQEDFLFAASLRENLTLGRRRVTPEHLAGALRASTAAPLVERLPEGLDAPVAERGTTFSAGERQLLEIARALAARPEVVVFDEATASVDSETEARIEEATARLLVGKSALVIAHRLSTVRTADQILVLHRGELREQGTHADLLAQGGLYRRLVDLAFARPEDAD